MYNRTTRTRLNKILKPLGHRICSKCHTSRRFEYYHISGKYHKSYCKPCTRVYELNKPEDKKAAKREDYKRWVQENRAYNTARHKKWSEENRPARLAMRARTDGKRRAQKMKTEVKDCPMVAALYTMARILTNTCEPMHVDHIYPLSKGGAHTFDNLQILTARDNLAKGNKI